MRLALAVGTMLALAACGGDSTGPGATTITRGDYVLVGTGVDYYTPGQLTFGFSINGVTRDSLAVTTTRQPFVGGFFNVDAYYFQWPLGGGALAAFRVKPDGSCTYLYNDGVRAHDGTCEFRRTGP